jgi:hypothetical protein
MRCPLVSYHGCASMEARRMRFFPASEEQIRVLDETCTITIDQN